MNQFIVLGVLAFAMSSCGLNTEEKKSGEIVSAIEAGDENDASYLKKNKEALAQAEKELKEESASIKTGSENNCVFKVTNTGTKPLLIQNVEASCGCTTPQNPEGPIAPGKSDIIKVGFKPNGPGPSEKTVTITANTEPRIQVVKIKADVK